MAPPHLGTLAPALGERVPSWQELGACPLPSPPGPERTGCGPRSFTGGRLSQFQPQKIRLCLYRRGLQRGVKRKMGTPGFLSSATTVLGKDLLVKPLAPAFGPRAACGRPPPYGKGSWGAEDPSPRPVPTPLLTAVSVSASNLGASLPWGKRGQGLTPGGTPRRSLALGTTHLWVPRP